MVPLFWVWVWWFRSDLLDQVVLFMQATVCILMIALGHNSFTRIYITYRQLSGEMIATMYLPHGGLEMLAFVLAGTSALLCSDALKRYLQENEKSRDSSSRGYLPLHLWPGLESRGRDFCPDGNRCRNRMLGDTGAG